MSNWKIALWFLLVFAAGFVGLRVLGNKQLYARIPVDRQRMETHIAKLTGIQPARNSVNIHSLNQAAQYIADLFVSCDYRVEFQTFQAEGQTYKNVIASYGPAGNGSVVVVGAHYDVYQDTPGADDNASGVAGLLEIARLFKELHPEVKRRIVFVAYTLEEPPFFDTPWMGSAIHARSFNQNHTKIKSAIVLEMIGYYSDKADSQEYPVSFLKWFYPNTANYIALVSNWDQAFLVRRIKRHMSEIGTISIQTLTGPKFLKGLDFSDHRNYLQLEFPALMVTDTSFYRNPYYHETNDTLATLDLKRMAETVRCLYWAVYKEARE